MQNVKTTRFLLINVVSPFTSHHEANIDLEELKSLVQTFGGATIVRVIQRRMHPDSSTFVGSGKALEVAEYVQKERIDNVVINAIVNPSQLFNLKKMLWEVNPKIEVWDRVDLILQIFEKHAHTAEAKLQIRLAQVRHMGPRIYGLGGILSRQGGGIGTRGLGETNIELMKRHWRNEVKHINDQLEKVTADRERQLERRKEQGFKTISIIGYTNAGKTTLYNKLTGKDKLARNIMFATLDSNVGKLYLPASKKNILVSDTIGFIQNLPPKLIEAFRSTLLESIHADVLLHVIDASDMRMHDKIGVVEQTLLDLGIQDKKRIYVFNKIDAESHLDKPHLEDIYYQFNPQFISVKTESGLNELKKTIEDEVIDLPT